MHLWSKFAKTIFKNTLPKIMIQPSTYNRLRNEPDRDTPLVLRINLLRINLLRINLLRINLLRINLLRTTLPNSIKSSNKKQLALTLLALTILTSCNLFTADGQDNSSIIQDQLFEIATYDVSQITPDSSLFFSPFSRGDVNAPPVDEASGLAVSGYSSRYLWTHNDSGDEPRIFLLDLGADSQGNDGSETANSIGGNSTSSNTNSTTSNTNSTSSDNSNNNINSTLLAGEWILEGASNRDWEDMTAGPGSEEGVHYLYIGEIGDNQAQYDFKIIYRFPEPNISTNSTTSTIPSQQVDRILFRYPNDVQMDAEALLVDPLTTDIYIITKREEPVTVYRLAWPHSTDAPMTADKVATLPFTQVTAGAISPNGLQILLKTYETIFLWTRNPEESIVDALMRPPARIPYTPEPQGEAIVFGSDGQRFFTLSEESNNIKPKLYEYRKREL